MPIWEALQRFWAHSGEALQEPEYVHVLLNHLPVTGLFVAFLGLLVTIAFRRRAGVVVALVFVGVFSLSAWPVVYFGEQGFDRVVSMTYVEGEKWLRYHRLLVARWKWLFYGTGLLALLAAVSGIWRRKSLYLTVPLVIVLTAGSLVVGAVISESGGRVRHDEFRSGEPAPEMEKSEQAETS